MGSRLEAVDWEGLAVKFHGNVDAMSTALLISRKTVERHFQDKWKMSPHRWAKKVVLGRSLVLLRQGYSNKAIVGDLNLCSESWFCREFKKHYGATPQAFRLLGLVSDANRSF